LDHISPYAPLAVEHPVMLQRWRFLSFLHWRYPADYVRGLLPPGIELDTFDGAAWIGLTPFLLTDLRIPHTPALPWISAFAETNVRTYVRGRDGDRAIWFFTLEADRLLGVVGARLTYRLPYRWSKMAVSPGERKVEYRSKRSSLFGPGESRISIEIGEPLVAGDLENFLTARYRLYTARRGRLAFAQIEHARWPLHSARVVALQQTLFEHSGVQQPTGEPHVLYSPDLLVKIGRLRWC
jgi:uncharacterized protein